MHWKRPHTLTVIPAIVIFIGLGGVLSALGLSHNPAFCSRVCHLMAPYYASYDSSADDLLAHRHAVAGVVCKNCHPTDLLLQAKEVYVAISGQYDTPLQERVSTAGECYACHAHASYESVVALTAEVRPANPHDSHWGEMQCRMCHKMHRASVDYCEQCHNHGFDVP